MSTIVRRIVSVLADLQLIEETLMLARLLYVFDLSPVPSYVKGVRSALAAKHVHYSVSRMQDSSRHRVFSALYEDLLQ